MHPNKTPPSKSTAKPTFTMPSTRVRSIRPAHPSRTRSQLDLICEKMNRATQQQQNQQGRGFKEATTVNRTIPAEAITCAEDPTNTSVFFWNLPHNITEQTLYNLCAYYGHVRSIFIKYPKNSPEYSTQNVLAFVTMNTHADAVLVINNLHGYSLDVFSRVCSDV